MPKFGSEKKISTDVTRESGAKPSVESSNVKTSQPEKAKTAAAVAQKTYSRGWVSRWGAKLGSLVSQNRTPARSAIPRLNNQPVQGEFSLDNIKVVRNDLSDADLEVVTRTAAPAKKTEAPELVLRKSASAEKLEELREMASAVES